MGKIFQHNDPVTPCVPTNTTTATVVTVVAIVAHGHHVPPLHPYFASLPRLLCPCQIMMILIMMNLVSCQLLFMFCSCSLLLWPLLIVSVGSMRESFDYKFFHYDFFSSIFEKICSEYVLIPLNSNYSKYLL